MTTRVIDCRALAQEMSEVPVPPDVLDGWLYGNAARIFGRASGTESS